MEDGKAAAAAAAMAQQQQLMQQQMLMQQIQRQKDAMSRFPSNIDAHLRPQHQHQHQHQHPSLLHPRPLTNPNPNSAPQQQQIIPNQLHPNPNPNPNPNSSTPNQQQQQQHKASLQLAYQDAWRVCHPDFKRPFSSLEDACERLLPYHVVADYEAEEDDKILDSATTGQVLSRSQQWDNNIAAKVAEFTATFEKQVLAFNIISRKRGLGEFRTEEKLMMEQFLLQEEKRSLLELRAEMDSRQKANRETHEANMRMAAMAHVDQARVESQAHAEMMARAPIRGSALVARGSNTISPDMGEQEQDFHQDDIMNGWGSNVQKDDKEPSEDFLNDDETENGDNALQSDWPEGGELDLNAR
ncbi:mediator of RNA polymerase II transcription subunit-like protein [Perilla frutescens var. hirtella]|nr:mediator of RNA polymerase II transcription subunit-like protein [Perilla frutescens var. hirtella]